MALFWFWEHPIRWLNANDGAAQFFLAAVLVTISGTSIALTLKALRQTRLQHLAATLPVIACSTRCTDGSGSDAILSVTNVGKGPALHFFHSFHSTIYGEKFPVHFGSTQLPPLREGETHEFIVKTGWIRTTMINEGADVDSGYPYIGWIRLGYADIYGRRGSTRSLLAFSSNPENFGSCNNLVIDRELLIQPID